MAHNFATQVVYIAWGGRNEKKNHLNAPTLHTISPVHPEFLSHRDAVAEVHWLSLLHPGVKKKRRANTKSTSRTLLTGRGHNYT